MTGKSISHAEFHMVVVVWLVCWFGVLVGVVLVGVVGWVGHEILSSACWCCWVVGW